MSYLKLTVRQNHHNYDEPKSAARLNALNVLALTVTSDNIVHSWRFQNRAEKVLEVRPDDMRLVHQRIEVLAPGQTQFWVSRYGKCVAFITFLPHDLVEKLMHGVKYTTILDETHEVL